MLHRSSVTKHFFLFLLALCVVATLQCVVTAGDKNAYAATAGSESYHGPASRGIPDFDITIDYDASTGVLVFSGSGTLGGLSNCFMTERIPDIFNSRKIVVDVKKIIIKSGVVIAEPYFSRKDIVASRKNMFSNLQRIEVQEGAQISDPKLLEYINNLSSANVTDDQGITYKDATKQKITRVTPTGTAIVIPASVKEIAVDAFGGCMNTLQSIEVAAGNTHFASTCGALFTSDWHRVVYIPQGIQGRLELPEGLQTIHANDLKGRPGITAVTIPASLTSITCEGDHGSYLPFSDDTNLSSISVATGNPVYSVTDGVLYEKNNEGMIAFDCIAVLTGAITIPEGVTDLKSVFYGCEGITSIEVPTTVKTIGDDAFGRCSSLTSITLKEGLTAIAGRAFEECTALTSIHIPRSVTSIKQDAFYNCTRLVSFDIAAGSHFRFANGTLYGKKDEIIFEVAWPTGRTYIFFPADTMTAVIPADRFVHGRSFKDCCTNLQKIVSYNPAYRVDEQGVLLSADGTTLIKAPSSLTGTYNVPKCVIRIGYAAFEGCQKLTSVIMPEQGIKDIESRAFKGIPLKAIRFPSTLWQDKTPSDFPVDSVVPGPLFTLDSSNSITIPPADNTTNPDVNHTLALLDLSLYGQSFIPSYVFSCLYGLTEVTIPKNVMILGPGSFFGCLNLKRVYAFNQNLQIADAGTTGDPALGWTSPIPSSFSTKAEEGSGFATISGITFYGLNYKSNTVKAYADKTGCLFCPFAFLGGYGTSNIAHLIEGGQNTLNYLTSCNTVSIADMTYTGEYLDPNITVTYAALSEPLVGTRTLKPDEDCTVVYKDATGVEVPRIVHPGTYTAAITGDGKSVFGTKSATFTVVGPGSINSKNPAPTDPATNNEIKQQAGAAPLHAVNRDQQDNRPVDAQQYNRPYHVVQSTTQPSTQPASQQQRSVRRTSTVKTIDEAGFVLWILLGIGASTAAITLGSTRRAQRQPAERPRILIK